MSVFKGQAPHAASSSRVAYAASCCAANTVAQCWTQGAAAAAFICVLNSFAAFLLTLFQAHVCSFYRTFIICLLLLGLFASNAILCVGFMQAGHATP